MKLQVGVKIFLKNEEDKFLFVKRSSEKYKEVKDCWGIVGGRIDPGSLLIDNLRREVKEETGLEIVSEPILICAQDIIPNEDLHVVRLSYVGETQGEPVLDTAENIEYKWLGIDEILLEEGMEEYVIEIVEKGLLR